jgi:hypothetical protein
VLIADRQIEVTRIRARMSGKRTHSILLLTAIFHLLADVAFAGGSVLCVGPNDHAQIEAGHVALDCGSFRSAAVRGNDWPLAIGDASDCVDIPLHEEAERVSEELSWDLDRPSVVDSTLCSDLLQKRGRDLHVGQGADLTPTMRAHRSIVLIV